MLAKNEGILAPKPLGRGIWHDFYALFPGDLEGFCLIVKTNPRGCPGGQPPGKPMISALPFYSNKRRGAYLIFRVSCAALIRGRRLFEGGAY